MHEGLFTLAQDRLNLIIGNRGIVHWCTSYFGTDPNSSFCIDLGMLNGGSSYGPHFSSPGRPDELHSVLGVWVVDEDGLPKFTDYVVDTIIHEFCHSFVNPVVDDHASLIDSPGRTLYSFVSEKMESQAYGNWRTMICESLVRAVSIRWAAATSESDKISRVLRFHQELGFFWLPELNDLFIEYENDRDRYPTLESYFPIIERFFSSYATNAESRIAAVESAWAAELEERIVKSPHVVEMQPANGSVDVDPSLSVITFTFDREMMDQNWAVMGTGNLVPKIAGAVGFNDAMNVFIMPVSLLPSSTYEFSLNKPKGGAFRDKEGNQLIEYLVRFSTRRE